MKYYALLLFILFTLTSIDIDSIELKKEYHFNDYTVITGFCDGPRSALIILHKDTPVLNICAGDGFFMKVDTININDDGVPDFVMSYNLETYFCMDFLISKGGQADFFSVNLEDEYCGDPQTCGRYGLMKEYEVMLDFIVVITNGESKVIVDPAFDGERYRSVPDFTDTITIQQILDSINVMNNK